MPKYYAINLARSHERWSVLSKSAQAYKIDLTRVEAVDGSFLDPNKWESFDTEKFKRCNGRPAKPGEYGCYQSHINALNLFLKSGHPTGVILEDDVLLNSNLEPFCDFLDKNYKKELLIVRLTSHRIPWFEKQTVRVLGFAIGRCWFGPTGSSAAYWITRAGAEQLLSKLNPGYLPVDIMIERSWHHGVDVIQTKPTMLKLPANNISVIEEDKGNPYYAKFRWYKRFPTYYFRTFELFRRFFYNARSRSINFE
ncbi:glycosyltransferase family 25 protein [Ahrensia sp. 13_GOM-1096m]|uniref:glycosyltransferase family 25 protein n=1 Tax=Ahrensia sp. 13_GOM-1096m TaxID=1380380 RepID=UPI000687AEBF|nr:glycosyltransferase family 25 protein [Ahrensia sp. 13_GOM-1096m]